MHNKEKQLLIKLSIASIVAAFPIKANAQSLNCPNPLVFGEIITCGSPGTVTVRPDNTNTSGCVTVSGPVSRARCVVTQSPPFDPIQISVSAASFNIVNGGNSMSVTNFNIITNSNGRTATRTSAFVDVPIGATLNVGATQAAGTYTGSFGVTAIFQ